MKDLDSSELRKIPGYNLWEACLKIPCSLHRIEYQYCIEVDSSFHVDLRVFGNYTFLEKSKLLRTPTFYATENASWNCQLAIADSNEDKMNGYFEHSFYILNSATNDGGNDWMLQMKGMENFSYHFTNDERKFVLQKLIQKMKENKLTQRINCIVFAFVLLQTEIPSSILKNILSSDFATHIFHQCLTIQIDCIANSRSAFCTMMENVYACSENANVLAFCNHMWYFSDAKSLSSMLSKRRHSAAHLLPLQPKGEEQSKDLIRTLVNRVLTGHEGYHSTTFLENLQRLMSFDLQIELFKQLTLVNIEMDKFCEILLSLCKRKMSEFSKLGEIICILDYWEKICSVLSPDAIKEWTEKCLIASFDKANEAQLKTSCCRLKTLGVSDNLFLETTSQIKLLKKFSLSVDENVHILVPVFLKEKRFQCISSNELMEIVLSWFDHATKQFCGIIFNRKEVSDSLVKLYSFVGEILSNEWICLHSELLEELNRKTYEYIHGVEISAILHAMLKMETFADGPVKDLFTDHLQTLLILGLGNGDINKSELFGLIQSIEVNSK